jgi:hypothetical protein
MKQRGARTKIKKKKAMPPKRAAVREELSPIRLFFMERLKAWCNEPEGRDERTTRKHEIATFLGKNVQTIKNMYLYGQGSMDDWFAAMDRIGPLKQETVIQLYNSFPYIEQKLNSLNPEQLRMHRNIAKMTERELALVNKLVEVGLKANRASGTGERI